MIKRKETEFFETQSLFLSDLQQLDLRQNLRVWILFHGANALNSFP
jgi:hypothetical protein